MDGSEPPQKRKNPVERHIDSALSFRSPRERKTVYDVEPGMLNNGDELPGLGLQSDLAD
jgi:hypothetical protein